MIHGGWRVDEVRIWCAVQGLDRRDAPVSGQLDLGAGDAGDGPHPAVRADGHLRAEWVEGSWRDDADAAARWAQLALQVHRRQLHRLGELDVAGDPMALARSESAAEILCAELELDGLPVDVTVADGLITSLAGPRAGSEANAVEQRAARDAEVLRHVPGLGTFDLRNPADVKAMLRRAGIDVPDTRAWRLEAMREAHPVVDALLQWRKAERIATTFGHGWLDQHVGVDGRLRGAWSSTDGAVRMTAQAGLNLPAALAPGRASRSWMVSPCRPTSARSSRWVLAVSGDRGWCRPPLPTISTDRWPIGCGWSDRSPRWRCWLAMYGQTSGTAGQALQGMWSVPTRWPCSTCATPTGQVEARSVHVRWPADPDDTVAERDHDPDEAIDDRSVSAALAARGRYARNATAGRRRRAVQGGRPPCGPAWSAPAPDRAVSASTS
ncbi:MAG: hypothetical protein R2713_22865 [Ilumatobacteraceae bacterium]